MNDARGDGLAPSFGLIGAIDNTHIDTRNQLVEDLVHHQVFSLYISM
jgi:hypothetical protein